MRHAVPPAAPRPVTLVAATLVAAVVAALLLLWTADAWAQTGTLKPYAQAASALAAPPPVTKISPAALAVPPPRSTLRYTRLNGASMVPIARDAELQVQRTLGREKIEVKAFPGVVQVPVALHGGDPPRLVPAAFVDDVLRFDARRGVFEGRIAVGLVAIDGHGSAALPEAVQFQVIGDVQTEPESVPVARASPPFPSIRVVARDPGKSVSLRVLNNLSPEPVQLEMRVARAQLRLHGTSRLQGFGVDTAEFTVEASDAAASKGLPVALSIDRGSVQPGQVELGPNGTAHVTVRSESGGRARLVASSTLHDDGARELEFEPPWRALGACVIGGGAGGVLRPSSGRRVSGRRRAVEVGLAVLCGTLVWGLSVLGVNLLAVDLPAHGGEVLAFVVGALGALSGAKLLEKANPAV